MGLYTSITRDWLEHRYQRRSATGTYFAHMPIYGYGTQDAFYDRGCQALGIDAVGIFAAIEVVGHHGIRVYRVGREARPHLRQMVGDWLAIVRGCQSTGLWPSYATGIVEVNPPAWWFKQFADGEN